MRGTCGNLGIVSSKSFARSATDSWPGNPGSLGATEPRANKRRPPADEVEILQRALAVGELHQELAA